MSPELDRGIKDSFIVLWHLGIKLSITESTKTSDLAHDTEVNMLILHSKQKKMVIHSKVFKVVLIVLKCGVQTSELFI